MSDCRPDAVDALAMERICPETDRGWLWYCDEHDTHGNADSQLEAEHMARAHTDYFAREGRRAEEPCEPVVWRRAPNERIGPRIG